MNWQEKLKTEGLKARHLRCNGQLVASVIYDAEGNDGSFTYADDEAGAKYVRFRWVVKSLMTGTVQPK